MTTYTPRPSYGQPCATVPILDLIKHMPLPGEDVEVLVASALEYEGDRYEKEPLAYVLPKEQDSDEKWRYTGDVQLFRFSPTEEESYLEEQNRQAEHFPPIEADEVPDLDLEEPAGDETLRYTFHSTQHSFERSITR